LQRFDPFRKVFLAFLGNSTKCEEYATAFSAFWSSFFCRGNNSYKSSFFAGETIHISAY